MLELMMVCVQGCISGVEIIFGAVLPWLQVGGVECGDFCGSSLRCTSRCCRLLLSCCCRSAVVLVQEYNYHLGAVNTVTFIDDARRFVSSSDDKSLRVWEFGIPVQIKYIAGTVVPSAAVGLLGVPTGVRQLHLPMICCQLDRAALDRVMSVFQAA